MAAARAEGRGVRGRPRRTRTSHQYRRAPSPTGSHERAWSLGEHGPRLFGRAGNTGPGAAPGWRKNAQAGVVP
ncbi:hypothetical protein [Streptomyces cremeus]|uniref:Uncharacterized protein n=1 Tax=Streptomyces cremeus TaxID=66881 RepID=A0ABV5P726_STRCM